MTQSGSQPDEGRCTANVNLSPQKDTFGVDFPFSEPIQVVGFSLNPTGAKHLLQAKPGEELRPADAQAPRSGSPGPGKGQMYREAGHQNRLFGVAGICLVLSFVLHSL